MALGAKYILCNAAAQAWAVTIQDLIDGLSPGDPLFWVPVPGNLNGTALATGDFPATDFGASGDAGTAGLIRIQQKIHTATSTTNMRYDFPGVDLGRLPLFWKVTDNSHLLSVA